MRRRDFLKTALICGVSAQYGQLLITAGASPGSLENISDSRFGPIQQDPGHILNLPKGFYYQIISGIGQEMEDGLKVPGWPDGMHAFPLDRDRIIILCNHELDMTQTDLSCWQGADIALKRKYIPRVYDRNRDGVLAPGGVRRLVYNLKSRRLERQHMALVGTLRNCSGGMTPWSSWISCEESVAGRGEHGLYQSHGYCFEVPAKKAGMQQAVPIKAMGRFNHEAALVEPATGIVYMTEDRRNGLFYRYLPDSPGNLAAGGRLQALAVKNSAGALATGNQRPPLFPVQEPQDVGWVDLENVDSSDDHLRQQGISRNAATFIRGEGMALQQDNKGSLIWFMCTEGGVQGLGQIFNYRLSPDEGRHGENKKPGQLTLFSEPNNPQLLRHGDNLVLMPNGDLLVCEDHDQKQRLIGVTPEGSYYVVAENARSAAEFAGATFSFDGMVLFVNLQQQNSTLAITGPWHNKVQVG